MTITPLHERVVAITGASSGIGEALALAAASGGASVALGARRLDRLERIVARIRQQGGNAIAIETDVSDEQQAHRFVDAAREQFGHLDAVVNNAGLMRIGPIETTDSADWRAMIDVNILGVLYTTQAAVRVMRPQGHGHIVNVSSIAARRTRPGNGVYSLTKSGVNFFSEALRMEVAVHGIRVTVIEPGAVDTELLAFVGSRAGLPASRNSVTPLNGDDIARAIVYALAQPPNVEVNHMFVRPISPAP